MRQIGTAWRAWRGSAAGLTILGRHHLSPQHTAAPRSFITLCRLHSLRRLKAMQFQTLAHRLLQLTQLRTVPGLSLWYIQQSAPNSSKPSLGSSSSLFHELPSTLFGKDGCFNGCLDNDGPSNNARSTTVGGLCPGIPWCPKSPQHSPLYSLLTLQSADNARSQKEGPGGADPAPLSPAAGLWRSRPATDVCALWE